MAVKVLIVDDSVFFRNRISQILRADPRIRVLGFAKNGREAVALAKELRPDVITMDVEMPEMNGIEALKLIMKETPCQVMMLSSLTRRSATVTLQALEYGAADYMAKDAKDWVQDSHQVGSLIIEKVIALGGKNQQPLSRVRTGQVALKSRVPNTAFTAQTKSKGDDQSDDPASIRFPSCRIVVVGSSTGGPAALQEILPHIPAGFPLPILLIQHMPKTFTSVFAQRLNEICQISVKEAEDGDRLLPGHAYLAPGGHQLVVDPSGSEKIKILPGDERVTYKPSVDITFASVAKSYASRVLAVVLTGMGADGCEGARLLKSKGATVWAQNKSSCTIFGMPKAVISAGHADSVLSLSDIGGLLKKRGER